MQRLVGGPHPFEVCAGITDRFPQLGHAGGEFAADGSGHRYRVVQFLQDLARAAKQRLASEGELDPMGRAAQQVTANEPH